MWTILICVNLILVSRISFVSMVKENFALWRYLIKKITNSWIKCPVIHVHIHKKSQVNWEETNTCTCRFLQYTAVQLCFCITSGNRLFKMLSIILYFKLWQQVYQVHNHDICCNFILKLLDMWIYLLLCHINLNSSLVSVLAKSQRFAC